jgi:hypothetical protein
MARVVYTIIDSIENLAGAYWVEGDHDSCERTAAILKNREGYWDVRLIGLRDKCGSVSPHYAVTPSGAMKPISAWHVTLAQFFLRTLQFAPIGNILAPSIADLPANVVYIMRQLMSIECGAGRPTGDETVHHAALKVMADLRAIGVPCGDWTYLPMLAAYHAGD